MLEKFGDGRPGRFGVDRRGKDGGFFLSGPQLFRACVLLAGVPAAAFLITLAWILRAGGAREHADWDVGRGEKGPDLARRIVLIALAGSKVCYGIVEALYTALLSGAFGGIPSLGRENLSAALAVGVTANVLTILADGFVAADTVKRGELSSAAGWRKTIIRAALVEFAAILGLLFFTLWIMNAA